MRLPIIDALDLRRAMRGPSRTPRVYLAARYSRRPELLGVRWDLERAGYQVTSRWINGGHQAESTDCPTPDQIERMASFAADDLEDLGAADVVISFQEVPREPTTNRGGRHVEFGMALALGKPIVAVGPLEHVFTALPQVTRFSSWAAALGVLADLGPAWGTGSGNQLRPLDASDIVRRRWKRLQVETFSRRLDGGAEGRSLPAEAEILRAVASEVERQDRLHPDGFPATRDGLRLAIAAIQDETAEVLEAWRAGRCKCDMPRCGHHDWGREAEEMVQLAALPVRALRSIAERGRQS
jgi:hypothetical protein